MKLSEALAETMAEFELTGSAVASTAGITETRLSRYLAGTAIKTDGLDRVLDTLDDEVFRRLIEKFVANRDLTVTEYDPDRIAKMVAALEPHETAEVLNAIAEKFRTESQKSSQKAKVLVASK